MKRYYALLSLLILSSCGRFGTKEGSAGEVRMVCLSKQYNEIIYALGAQKDLVGVDISSTWPPEIKSVTTVGYHRALSAEGILATKPTLIVHDNNVGPEQVMKQLTDLKIPMKVFDTKGEDIASTQALIREMGAYFHREQRADSICQKLTSDMNKALAANDSTAPRPRVVMIHYGRANNVYLTMMKGSTAGKLIAWAGGDIPLEGERGMQQLSAEIIAKADPDVILLTDFGYDKLGSLDEIKTLPGVAGTKAAKADRIFRVEERDVVYVGPRTGENVLMLRELIHRNGVRP